MKFKTLSIARWLMFMALYTVLGSVLGAVSLFIYIMNDRPDLHPWHTVKLDNEYTLDKQKAVPSFEKYLELEDRLFQQLQTEIHSAQSLQASHDLNRYDAGSLADPTSYPRNWNRSFVMEHTQPRGGVLLLHGLSDSPYSLLTLAKTLHEQGYYVLGLRMPGHGTAPSGLVHASWQDMAAAVNLAARYIDQQLDAQLPMHVFGYSMGAAQAVNYALDSIRDETVRKPASLVLISPAIGVSSVAAFAVWQSRLAAIPGLEKLAWNSIGPEYDPYKYTSFAVNAGDLMYRLTLEIDRKLSELEANDSTRQFPKTLAVLSLVDSTVSISAVVTHLLDRLDNQGNELVVFDLNRSELLDPFIRNDPIVDYRRLLDRGPLKFDLSFLTNESPESSSVSMHRWSQGKNTHSGESTGLKWPDHVYSLSHVAMPFPPTDSLYGYFPEDDKGLHIGMLASRGERNVLNIPASDMLRLRFNPFYSFMEQRITDFLAETATH